jgi:hypothetical protein
VYGLLEMLAFDGQVPYLDERSHHDGGEHSSEEKLDPDRWLC